MKITVQSSTKLFIILLVVCVFSLVESSFSQTRPRSTRGKEFWISWPDNGSPVRDFQGYEIFTNCNIYVFGTKPTNGYYEYNGKKYPFRLRDTNNYFFGEALNEPMEVIFSELVQKKSVYIYTDDSVNVYASSMSDSLGLDATVVFPTSSLGREYYIIARKEGTAKTQFLIVAPFDSTQVEITPSTTTEEGRVPNIPFTVTLQKGQTFMVRSNNDLTGSRVRSLNNKFCHPIAVFTGSPQTNIGGCGPSNYLWEQIPPDVVLGSRYIIPKYPNTSGSIVRALAIQPGTQIRLEGINQGPILNTGQFVEMRFDSVVYISGNKPFLLAHFTRGGHCNPQSASLPTMTILSAVSQLQRYAALYAPVGNRFLNSDLSTVNIVVKFGERGVTRINGSPINPNFWRIVPGNPEYATYQTAIAQNELIRIFNDMSGFTASIHGTTIEQGFSMTAGGDFSQTIVGGLDTAGIYGKTTFCKGEVANLRALVDPSATSFRWEFGDGAIDTGRTVSHIYKNAGPYFLRLIIFRGAFCAYDTNRRLITVRPSPDVKAGSRPILTLCKGQTATLGTNQIPGISYRWSPAIGLSDTTVGQPTVTGTEGDITYIVRGYDSFGCETKDTIVVRTYSQPIANAGPDTVSCGGNGVQIGRATTGGTPLYSFLWTPSAGLSNPNIERPIAAPDTTTTYILRVTDINSCVDYDTVVVQALPSPSIDAGNPTTICEGDSVQLTATATDNPLFRWVNARNITDSSIGNPFVFPTTTTTYYVAGIFSTGCVAFDSVLVTVTPKPRLPIAFQTTACPNATKTYTVENRGDLTYAWEIVGGNLTNGQDTNEATVVWGAGPTGSIKITTTTTTGSCKFDTVVTITISSDIKPTITENKKNTIIPSRGTVRICPNESVTLDVGVGYTEITWTNGSTNRQTTISTEGWYGVQVKDATGCSGGDSVYVQTVLPPTVFAGNDRVLCGADTAIMRGNVTGSGTYTYQWIPPTAVSDPTALITDFIAPTTTQLIFQAIDTVNGCKTSDTVLMTVLTLAGDFITTSKQNNVLCFGEQMTLDAGAFDSYTWSTGETTRTINITNGGNYWVDAKSGSCSAIDTIQIIQNPQIVVIPTPDITASPGATVTLDANASGGTLPYQFQWSPNVNFQDPTTIQSPRVTTNVGSQSYVVTITDANDCVARDTITVFVPSTSTTVTVARREVSASALNVSFPLTLTLEPNTSITPTGFTATVTVPFEQFIPKSVTKGDLIITQNATDYVVNITVPITEPLYHNSIITELVGDILLGQQDTTPILISNAQWQGTTYPVNGVNGAIVLNDVCYSGTRRYLLPTTIGFGIMSINPNPAQHTATFEFGIIEAGKTTFEIIDVFGNVVHSTDFYREPATPKGGTTENRYTHVVDVSSLPSGTYYGVLKSFSQRATVPLVITK
jgi:hypothetical protein